MTHDAQKPVTIRTLQKMAAEDEPIPMLTCYDATTARHLARGGVPTLLVGDTAAEMILGFEQTLQAPLDFMIRITAAVKRGAPQCFVTADMPFMSYQAEHGEAIRNAGRFMVEGLADAVKLEVSAGYAELVEKLSQAGVPVVAHLGTLPQHVRRMGGYRSAGKTAEQARELVSDARLMESCGAAMLLLEATPPEISERIVEQVSIPVIGCGAGPACHGQVVVLHDLLGLSDWQPPFAPPIVHLGEQIADAAGQWRQRVSRRQTSADAYAMQSGEAGKFAGG